jgi:hypothetical protein
MIQAFTEMERKLFFLHGGEYLVREHAYQRNFFSMEHTSIVAIDVASQKLDLCWGSDVKNLEHATIPYTEEELKRFVAGQSDLIKRDETLIGLEATGAMAVAPCGCSLPCHWNNGGGEAGSSTRSSVQIEKMLRKGSARRGRWRLFSPAPSTTQRRLSRLADSAGFTGRS